MNAVLDPIISEFETQEQSDKYDRWFRAKVQEALDDSRPGISHDEVTRRMEERLAELRKVHASH